MAAAAIVLALAAVGYILLKPGGPDYSVHARFQNASQLVKGNFVQVAGAPDRQDHEHRPDAATARPTSRSRSPTRATCRCAAGTKAVVRQASLSGVANRYVDLQLPDGTQQQKIDDGGVIDQADTTTAVDLDQLFNTFDAKTRKALSGLIRGYSTAYGGRGDAANAGFKYLNPSLASSSRLFRELNYDTPLFRRFVVASSKLVTDVASRRDDLAGLVDHLATTTGAIGRQKRGAGRRARAAAAVHAQRELDVRQPARDARRPHAARQRVQAGRAEAAPLPRRAAPARPATPGRPSTTCARIIRKARARTTTSSS